MLNNMVNLGNLYSYASDAVRLGGNNNNNQAGGGYQYNNNMYRYCHWSLVIAICFFRDGIVYFPALHANGLCLSLGLIKKVDGSSIPNSLSLP